jgi:hypothetical protein
LSRYSDAFRHGQFAKPLDFSRFRDVPVLTELTSQIAACGSERKNGSAGEKVIEWFFLDRINAETSAATIGCQFHLAIDILANETESSITGFKPAVSGTKIAGNSAVVCEVPPFCCNVPVRIIASPFAECLTAVEFCRCRGVHMSHQRLSGIMTHRGLSGWQFLSVQAHSPS